MKLVIKAKKNNFQAPKVISNAFIYPALMGSSAIQYTNGYIIFISSLSHVHSQSSDFFQLEPLLPKYVFSASYDDQKQILGQIWQCPRAGHAQNRQNFCKIAQNRAKNARN